MGPGDRTRYTENVHGYFWRNWVVLTEIEIKRSPHELRIFNMRIKSPRQFDSVTAFACLRSDRRILTPNALRHCLDCFVWPSRSGTDCSTLPYRKQVCHVNPRSDKSRISERFFWQNAACPAVMLVPAELQRCIGRIGTAQICPCRRDSQAQRRGLSQHRDQAKSCSKNRDS